MSPVPFEESDAARVVAFFVATHPAEGQLARSLLDRGCPVVAAWGPHQMAVYHLVIRHGNWDVMLHSERGRCDWVRIGRVTTPPTPWDDYRPIGLAVLAWARSHDIPFRLDTPADVNHDLGAYGADALDWLDSGNEQTLERLYRAWLEDPGILSVPDM